MSEVEVVEQTRFYGICDHEQLAALKPVMDFLNIGYGFGIQSTHEETNWWGVWNMRKNSWKCFFRCGECARDEAETWGPDYLTVHRVIVGVPEKPNE